MRVAWLITIFCFWFRPSKHTSAFEDLVGGLCVYRCPVTRGTARVGSIGLGCQIRGGELFLLQAGCSLFPSERKVRGFIIPILQMGRMGLETLAIRCFGALAKNRSASSYVRSWGAIAKNEAPTYIVPRCSLNIYTALSWEETLFICLVTVYFNL